MGLWSVGGCWVAKLGSTRPWGTRRDTSMGSSATLPWGWCLMLWCPARRRGNTYWPRSAPRVRKVLGKSVLLSQLLQLGDGGVDDRAAEVSEQNVRVLRCYERSHLGSNQRPSAPKREETPATSCIFKCLACTGWPLCTVLPPRCHPAPPTGGQRKGCLVR